MSRTSHQRSLFRLGAVLALGLAVPATASARDFLAKTPSPRVDDPVSAMRAFTIEGGQDATMASVKLGFEDNRIENALSGQSKGRFATLAITLSAPLNGKGDFTRPLTVDGLTNDAAVGVQVAQLVIPGAKYGPNATTEEKNRAFGRVVLHYRGLVAKVSQKSHGFYDPVTLAKSETTRTPWRLGAFYALIGGDRSWSATFAYAHEVAYQPAASKNLCRTIAGTLLECVNGPIGGGAETKRNVLSLELRRSWGPRVLGEVTPHVGVAPKVAYDTESGVWAVGLPVYLFGDNSGLTGGLRADWEDKTHDLVLGVFVTKTFSIADGL